MEVAHFEFRHALKSNVHARLSSATSMHLLGIRCPHLGHWLRFKLADDACEEAVTSPELIASVSAEYRRQPIKE